MKLWQLAIMIGFGGAMGICGWCLGYGHAMRKVSSWLLHSKSDSAVRRDRRFSAVEHRSRLS